MFPLPQQDYTVMIVTATYNHVQYIENTLKGIVMQQTNFPIVACVLDDCSTDGTTEIVRRYEALYPGVIKGFYFKENQYSQGNRTIYKLKSWIPKVKYIAVCEGDDYWTDPLKLQKQVNLMDERQNCSLCIHNVNVKWENGGKPTSLYYPLEEGEYFADQMISDWIVSTASVMIRANILNSSRLLRILENKDFFIKDVPLWLYCGTMGKVYALNEVMAVYRRLDNGFTSNFQRQQQEEIYPNFQYCKHNLALLNEFENDFDEKFKVAVTSNFFSFVLHGMRASFTNHSLRYIVKFILLSVRLSTLRTVKIFYFTLVEYIKYGLIKDIKGVLKL